ncbi:hypothetical protein FB451DRAFT_313654 [Mycena latifolia]|nr:hypothetical protein FB451DRAFT_313654 [Mycena latifolia]
MPALCELSVLFSADLARDQGGLRPPFTLGTPDGSLLTICSPHLVSVTLSNMQPADPVFSQLPPGLEALHIRAAQDLYIPDRSGPQQLQAAPLTSVTVLAAIRHISHLTELAELSLTLDHFPTPTLIDVIATTFPYLRFLELECLGYPRGDDASDEVRDDALIEPLGRLISLTHLRISLDFFTRTPFPLQEGPQMKAARWFLQHLPALQSIAFSWQEWLTWYRFHGLQQVTWETYDRSILRFDWAPTPPESEDDEPIIGQTVR